MARLSQWGSILRRRKGSSALSGLGRLGDFGCVDQGAADGVVLLGEREGADIAGIGRLGVVFGGELTGVALRDGAVAGVELKRPPNGGCDFFYPWSPGSLCPRKWRHCWRSCAPNCRGRVRRAAAPGRLSGCRGRDRGDRNSPQKVSLFTPGPGPGHLDHPSPSQGLRPESRRDWFGIYRRP